MIFSSEIFVANRETFFSTAANESLGKIFSKHHDFYQFHWFVTYWYLIMLLEAVNIEIFLKSIYEKAQRTRATVRSIKFYNLGKLIHVIVLCLTALLNCSQKYFHI